MELNLRKARKLESSIHTYLLSNKSDPHAMVRVLGTVEEAKATVAKARDEALAVFPLKERLLRLRFKIRRDIEIQNEKLGINALINEKVLTSAISQLESITTTGPEGIDFDDQFAMELEKYNAPIDGYNRYKSTTYAVNVFTKADAEAAQEKKIELKRNTSRLEDKLGELNIVGKITLAEDDVKLLQTLGLL